MPFNPHTENDVQAMLKTIGADSIEQLFDEIPQELRGVSLDHVPAGVSEMAITRLMHERAAQDAGSLCFLGAGAYEHHIPAAVWEITTRGEFYSAYTPYQAEASQGTLQLLYEYQTMMASLNDMDVSNASLYDGEGGSESDADTPCMACGSSEDGAKPMLLCDGCDNAAHMVRAAAVRMFRRMCAAATLPLNE